MLKINKYEVINEEKVESICLYGSRPLIKIARMAKDKDSCRVFMDKRGIKTMIILDDGYMVLCPYFPDTYLKRGTEEKYLLCDPKRYLLSKKHIREITSHPNASQKRDIKQAKEDGTFINLARNKKIKYYVFMDTGRIYGLNLIKDDSVEL